MSSKESIKDIINNELCENLKELKNYLCIKMDNSNDILNLINDFQKIYIKDDEIKLPKKNGEIKLPKKNDEIKLPKKNDEIK